MQKLDSLIEKRRNNYKSFKEKMKQYNFIKLQSEVGKSSWFGFSMIVEDSASFTRDDLVQCFASRNIESRPIVCGNIVNNEMIKYFDYSVYGELSASEIVHNNGLFIGNHHMDINDGLDNLTKSIEIVSNQ
jgi:CDP-4-dehydro-6-deoxyglucose reductase, E1